jgi:hypothetical protein
MAPSVAGIAQTILAATVVGAFALFGADPYLQLLLWVNTPGVIGIVVLQALAAFAVLRYFRTHAHQESVLRSFVAPLVAGVLLIGAAALIVWQIDLLTGAGDTVNWILIALVPVIFILGVGYAPPAPAHPTGDLRPTGHHRRGRGEPPEHHRELIVMVWTPRMGMRGVLLGVGTLRPDRGSRRWSGEHVVSVFRTGQVRLLGGGT